MGCCCAIGCTHKTGRYKIEGLSFHRFPKDYILRKAWVDAVGRKDFLPSKYSMLCSEHFEEKDIDRTSLSCVRIREGAIPSIFPSFPLHLQKTMKTRSPICRQAEDIYIYSLQSSCKNFIPTLPLNLCLRPTGLLGKEYEVWSTEDILQGTRFGPHQSIFIDIVENKKKGCFHWQVKRKQNTMTWEGNDETQSDWLQYVNYASSKEQQNIIAFCCESGVYYVTCKLIPANTKLVVWHQIYIFGVEKGYNMNGTGNLEDGQRNPLQVDQPNHDKAEIESDHNYYQSASSQEEIHNGEEVYDCIAHGKKIFMYGRATGTHELKHTGELSCNCRECKRMLRWKHCFKSVERVHTGEKPYECSICRKTFMQKGSLKLHEMLHFGEKPYECKFCGKSFVYSWQLNQHESEHLYKCSVCEKEFTAKKYLKAHDRIHTGEKPYKCKVCGMKFTYSGQLTLHKSIHTGEHPYKCSVCGKIFARKKSLKSHERTHTGENPHECKVCGIIFSKSDCLKLHETEHTGERCYTCGICGRVFTRTGSLKTHHRICEKKTRQRVHTDKKFVKRQTLKKKVSQR